MSVPRGFLAKLAKIQENMPSVSSEVAYAQMLRARKMSEEAQLLEFNGPCRLPIVQSLLDRV